MVSKVKHNVIRYLRRIYIVSGCQCHPGSGCLKVRRFDKISQGENMLKTWK